MSPGGERGVYGNRPTLLTPRCCPQKRHGGQPRTDPGCSRGGHGADPHWCVGNLVCAGHRCSKWNATPHPTEILQTAEFKTRREAGACLRSPKHPCSGPNHVVSPPPLPPFLTAWALSNTCSGGSPEQIAYLVSQGCIPPLCDLLTVAEAKVVEIALDALDNILNVGELKAKCVPPHVPPHYVPAHPTHSFALVQGNRRPERVRTVHRGVRRPRRMSLARFSPPPPLHPTWLLTILPFFPSSPLENRVPAVAL